MLKHGARNDTAPPKRGCKMKKVYKRTLSWLLILAMIGALLPFAALAEEPAGTQEEAAETEVIVPAEEPVTPEETENTENNENAETPEEAPEEPSDPAEEASQDETEEADEAEEAETAEEAVLLEDNSHAQTEDSLWKLETGSEPLYYDHFSAFTAEAAEGTFNNQSNMTLTMLKDITIEGATVDENASDVIAVPNAEKVGEITIDLDGHTLKAHQGVSDAKNYISPVKPEAGANFTLCNGTVQAENTNVIFCADSGVEIDIENVSLTVTQVYDSKSVATVYVNGSSKVSFSGASCDTSANAGFLIRALPSDTIDFGNNITAAATLAYSSYVRYYDTFAHAVTGANGINNTATVTLLQDTTASVTISNSNTKGAVILDLGGHTLSASAANTSSTGTCAAITVESAATIKNGTVEGLNSRLVYVTKTADVALEDLTLTEKSASIDEGSGTSAVSSLNGPTITLTNCTVSSAAGPTFYCSTNAVVNFKSGTYSNSNTASYLLAGNCTNYKLNGGYFAASTSTMFIKSKTALTVYNAGFKYDPNSYQKADGCVIVKEKTNQWRILAANVIKTAADGSNSIISVSAVVPNAGISSESNPTMPKDNMVFAGFFADKDCTEQGSSYAKFVTSNILTAKHQIGTTSDGKTVLRLVSSVDGLKYDKVGFEVSYTAEDNTTKTQKFESGTVYQKIVGADESYTPASAFDAGSAYFITVNLIPSDAVTTLDPELTVTPYWITLNGQTVKGTSQTFKISEQ